MELSIGMTLSHEEETESAGERRQQPREDTRSLRLASSHLARSYQSLSPRLKDPERVVYRYSRAQQQAQWVVNNFRAYLPGDFVFQFEARIGRGYPSSPFDETVPSKRAVLRLRKLIRELLHLLASANEALSEASW
ncbi:MAG: hypothetical protein EXR50_05955 [Dehalococcoidia bacterium]|nr:hypothetical protein [Dehalococcoidia bacterium]